MSIQFLLTFHNFRFYGPFPVYISFIFNKSQIWSNLTYDSSKWSVKPENYFQKKKFGLGVKLQISGHLGSNFEFHGKWVNCISKWRSWRQLFDDRCLEVMRGHPRSKISKKVKLQTSMKHDKSYIKMMRLTRKKEVERTQEVFEGHKSWLTIKFRSQIFSAKTRHKDK